VCIGSSTAVEEPGVCTHWCVPGTTEGCPSPTVCDVFGVDDVAMTFPRATDCRTAASGTSCTECTVVEAYECAGGYVCAPISDTHVCMRNCTIGGGEPCPSGTRCQAFGGFTSADGNTYGRCEPETCP
jgi:hypothetical protein